MKLLLFGFFIHHGNVRMIFLMVNHSIIQVVLLLHYRLNRRTIEKEIPMINITLIVVIKINISFPFLFKDYIRIVFTLVEYFDIRKEDHINNNSYIESSTIIVCHEVILTFYSKVDSPYNNINLILFIHKQNVWNKEWEYRSNDPQWQLHQVKINITDKNKDIQVKLSKIIFTYKNIYFLVSISSYYKFF
jgi:hypothetical protein